MKNVVVIGDIIVDKAIYGVSTRTCPEAPTIHIVKVIKEHAVCGGAANVASSVPNLVGLVGIVGDDRYGQMVKEQFQTCRGMVTSNKFQTCVKTRIFVGDRMHARYDSEDDDMEEHDRLSSALDGFGRIDVLIVSDYNKNVVGNWLTARLFARSKHDDTIVLVDPKRQNWDVYRGATLIKPNVHELFGQAQSHNVMKMSQEQLSKEVISAVCERPDYKPPFVLVTLEHRGSILVDTEARTAIFCASSKGHVVDVTGAGDTTLSTLVHLIVARCSNKQELVNLLRGQGLQTLQMLMLGAKAAVAFSGTLRTGTSSKAIMHRLSLNIPLEKLIACNDENFLYCPRKLQTFSNLHRARKHTVVFTNGCFDVLHAGHLMNLAEARHHGDILVVGINTDASIKRQSAKKGRPILSLDQRMLAIAILPFVDVVIAFDETCPTLLLSNLRPDIIIKGGDYVAKDVKGQEYAGNVVILPRHGSFSTTSIVEACRSSM